MMEFGGIGSILRNRRLESYFDTNPRSKSGEVCAKAVQEVVKQPKAAEVYVEDDGWFSVLI